MGQNKRTKGASSTRRLDLTRVNVSAASPPYIDEHAAMVANVFLSPEDEILPAIGTTI